MDTQTWSTGTPAPAAPILIVDDDAEARGELREALAIQGREVIEATNGREALELLTSERIPEPCLILLDLRMPVMSGWEFLSILRSYHRLSRIPVIVLSGVTDAYAETNPPSVIRLKKPFSADLLLESVTASISTRS
ncbi:MAG TPA: response regulator [Polyangiaceae bacterium]|nr:response regulator [Polyangiaceae bacterium]